MYSTLHTFQRSKFNGLDVSSRSKFNEDSSNDSMTIFGHDGRSG